MNSGVRLPPDRYSLTACNHKLKATAKAKQTTINLPFRSLQTAGGTSLLSSLANRGSTSIITVPRPTTQNIVVTTKIPSNGSFNRIEETSSSTVKRKIDCVDVE